MKEDFNKRRVKNEWGDSMYTEVTLPNTKTLLKTIAVL